MATSDSRQCSCGSDCNCDFEFRRLSGRQTTMLVVAIVALLIALGSLVGVFVVNRHLASAKSQAAQAQTEVTELMSVLSEQSARADARAKADSAMFQQAMAEVSRAKTEAQAARDDAFSVAAQTAVVELRVAAVEDAQKSAVTAQDVNTTIQTVVDPMRQQQQQSLFTVNARIDSVGNVLTEQQNRLAAVNHRFETTGWQKIRNATTFTMAMTAMILTFVK